MRSLLAVAAALAAYGQPAPVTVVDTVRNPIDGGLFRGSIDIVPRPMLRGGSYFGATPKTVQVTAGSFAVTLQPTADAIPSGSSYEVTYRSTSGSRWTRWWVVPAAPATTTIAAIEMVVPPQPSIQITPGAISPGQNGQVLKTVGSAVVWAPDSGPTGVTGCTPAAPCCPRYDGAVVIWTPCGGPLPAALWSALTGAWSTYTSPWSFYQ